MTACLDIVKERKREREEVVVNVLLLCLEAAVPDARARLNMASVPGCLWYLNLERPKVSSFDRVFLQPE